MKMAAATNYCTMSTIPSSKNALTSSSKHSFAQVQAAPFSKSSSCRFVCSVMPMTSLSDKSPSSTSPMLFSDATVEELQEKTRKELLGKGLAPKAAMQLIDTLQWLGIAYHYEQEIGSWLERLSEWDAPGREDLGAAALRFRLLRQSGLRVASADVFAKFVDKAGKFRESLSNDKLGLLSLYEASYLGASNEYVLSEAMPFARSHLKHSLPNMAPQFSIKVSRALELPRHLRMARLESRRYIHEYSLENNSNSVLVEQAKLDYNQVQSKHQLELAEVSRWWKQLGLVEKLSFARDRPMECFLWTVGIFPHLKYSSLRVEVAKTIAILLVIDDIFDTYGSLHELSLFTQAVQRWDLDAMEQLPEYMKICYMALYNTTNEIAYNILKERGKNVLPFLRQVWIDTVEAFMVEADWFSSGYVPSHEDYLENGVTTAGSYMALVHSFFLLGKGINEESVKLMKRPYPKMFSQSGRILRLWDDLGTSKEEQERGDTSSSITLLMKERNLQSDEEAREYMMQQIQSTWKELNGALLGSSTFPLAMIEACFNMSRAAQVVYQHDEDSYFSSVDKYVNYILFEPIYTS